MSTPFDHPRGIIDRIIFPSLRRAYIQGKNDARETAVLRFADGQWPKRPTTTDQPFVWYDHTGKAPKPAAMQIGDIYTDDLGALSMLRIALLPDTPTNGEGTSG